MTNVYDLLLICILYQVLKKLSLDKPLKKIMQNAVQVAVHKKGMLYKKVSCLPT